MATHDGKRLPSEVPTKISIDDLVATLPGYADYFPSDPNLWFDPKQQRWVMVCTTVAPDEATERAPLVVAVSQTNNPLASWTVWALDATADVAPGLVFCRTLNASAIIADYPQVGCCMLGVVAR